MIGCADWDNDSKNTIAILDNEHCNPEKRVKNEVIHKALDAHYYEYMEGLYEIDFFNKGGIFDGDAYRKILKDEWGIEERWSHDSSLIIAIEDEQKFLYFLMAYG